MQIDGDVEPLPPQLTRKREVVADPGETATLRDDNDVSQITIPADDGRSRRFDDIGELGVRIPAAQRTNERCRQHHVTDQPQTD
jgi:hypothetical protein